MLRKLDPLERAVWLAGQHDPLNEIVIWRVRGDFTTRHFYTCLARLRIEQPYSALRVAVDPSLGPCLTTRGVHEHEVLEETDGYQGDWTRAAEQELARPFSWDRGPLLRFRLMRSPHYTDILFTLHHAIYDGLSAHYLFKHLLNIMAGRGTSQIAARFPPTLEQRIPAKAVRRFRKKASLIAFLMRSPLAHWCMKAGAPKELPPPPRPEAVPGLPRSSNFCVLNGLIPPEGLHRLLSRCRAQGVSVHAAVSAACLLALAGARGREKPTKLGFASPVSVRRLLRPPLEEEPGLYLSRVVARVKCSSNSGLWDIAKDIYENLRGQIRGEKLLALQLALSSALDAVPDRHLPSLLDFIRRGPQRYDFTISNLGRLQVPQDYGPYHLSDAWSMENLFAGRRTIAVQTLGDTMYLTLTFRDFVMSRQEAGRLLAEIIRLLEAN